MADNDMTIGALIVSDLSQGIPVTIFVDGRPVQGRQDWHTGLLDAAAHIQVERTIKQDFSEGRVPQVTRCNGTVERI